MNVPRPITIVGGGLAGLSLGIALRRAGVETQIIEAGHYHPITLASTKGLLCS